MLVPSRWSCGPCLSGWFVHHGREDKCFVFSPGCLKLHVQLRLMNVFSFVWALVDYWVSSSSCNNKNLMYLRLTSRPDIFNRLQMSRSEEDTDLWTFLLASKVNDQLKFVAFCDATWATNRKSRKSVSDKVIVLGSSMVDAASKKLLHLVLLWNHVFFFSLPLRSIAILWCALKFNWIIFVLLRWHTNTLQSVLWKVRYNVLRRILVCTSRIWKSCKHC